MLYRRREENGLVMSHRPAQVASLIQRYIGELIRRDLELPLGVIISVSQVSIGPDLKFAKILVSILPEDKRAEVLRYLNRNKIFLQKELARRLTMKFSPKIGFALDATASQVSRIDSLLDEIKVTSNK